MLEVSNITKRYEDRTILDNVSFKILDGRISVLTGRSGEGKTTLANIIALYDTPDSGEIKVNGIKAKSLRELKGDIELISQHPYSSFNPRKTIAKSLAEGPLALGYTKEKEIKNYLEHYIKISGADIDLIDRMPSELSGGEIQRIAIARALSVRPKVLICDEITSSLDAITSRGIIETIKELAEENLSILFITHDIQIGRYLSSTMLRLENGVISPFYAS